MSVVGPTAPRDAQRVQLALLCENVAKTFPIKSEFSIWRTFLGAEEKLTGEMIHALRDISLEVPRGKIVGILGKNGAGKSTLLRILGGVYQQTKGRVTVRGQVVGLFELGGMSNPNLTGIEYATRYLTIMGVKRGDLASLIEDIIEFSELDEAFSHSIRTYSSGMAARLYFATTTALQHEIYLIDELLSVGDEHFQGKCWRRMRARLLNGASGVLVTHDWTAIVKLCERTCVIEDGRFKFCGHSDEAVVNYLGLSIPAANQARFSPLNLQHQRISILSDEAISVRVEILENIAVDFAISIEILRVGIGWEIVVLLDHQPIAETSGSYRVDIPLRELPLAPGEYSLNVFLSRRENGQSLDVRSWTYGNSYDLTLEGEPRTTVARLPFVTRKPSAGNV